MLKTMNKQLQYLIQAAAALLLAACSNSTPPAGGERILVTDHRPAMGPYLTHDQENRPVLCWTEAEAPDRYRLAYAIYDTLSGSFAPAVSVAGSTGMGTSPESMGKVAFKSDGTVVAAFAKPFKGEKNPFAGAIYYTTSSDSGATWAPPRFLHTDTSHRYGRNFFDLARLGNGEVGAVWLDGRDTTVEGSTLYFAATMPAGGFSDERVLHSGTCECCRTDLLVDDEGTIHVAYRSLQYPTALYGEQVRDMAYIRSDDGGRTFSTETVISPDHWAIRACPHSGPALTADGATLHAVWFTAGGGTGIYHSQLNPVRPTTRPFSPRTRLTASGSHPQLVTIGVDTVAALYEDRLEEQHAHHHAHHHAHGSAHAAHSKSAILLHPIAGGQALDPIAITDGRHADHHPVAVRTGKGVLAAWVRETTEGAEIVYRLIR